MYTAKGGKVRNPVLSKTSKRSLFEHTLEYSNCVYVKPDGLGAIDDQRVIDFTINTGTSAYQFAENPLTVGFVLEELVSVGTGGEAKKQWQKSNNASLNAYIPDVLGPSCFISKTELWINNVAIADCSTGYGNLYQALSMRLCKPSVQKSLNVYHVPDTQDECESAKAFLKKTLDCSAGKRYVSGSVLGLPYLGPPKNLTLAQLAPQKGDSNSSDVLPPDCVFKCRFIMNDSKIYRLQRSGLVPSFFFLGKKPSSDADSNWVKGEIDPKVYRIRLTDIWLMANKLSFGHKSNIQRNILSREPLQFFYDKAGFSIQEINAGLQYTSSNHQIPAHTAMAYLCFPQGFQLWGDKIGSRPADCSLHSIPTNIRRIVVKLNDAIIQWPEGLHISSGNDIESGDRVLLYQTLKEAHLTDKSFQSFNSSQYSSYNNVFLIDLTKYDVNTPATISVSLEFKTSTLSTEGWQTVIAFPIESSFRRLAGGVHWERG